MIRKFLFILSAMCAALTMSAERLQIHSLKTNHLAEALGIDDATPRLTWQLSSKKNGMTQTAYEIYVSKDNPGTKRNARMEWQSGKVTSSRQLATIPAGILKPFTTYYWRVAVYDQKDRRYMSQPTSFETGIMSPDRWTARWISDSHDKDYRPAPYFRKSLTITKPVQKVRAYITAGGTGELYLNGQKVSENFLNPAFTTYDKRLLYTTYDITSLMRQGENAFGVLLGNGWYNHQALAVWDYHNAAWRNRPGFSMMVRIAYADGAEETLVTDQSWKTSGGPLVYDNIYTGEHYDFTKEMKGWNDSGFDDSGWAQAVEKPFPTSNITAQEMVPIKASRDYQPVAVSKIDDHTLLYDFGQNMSGYADISLHGHSGEKVKMLYGEIKDKEGRLSQSNIDYFYRGDKVNDPFQGDILILSGGEDHFRSRFSYKGFRYVEISSTEPIDQSQIKITARFTHSAVENIGEVTTSNELANKILHATNMSYLSNLQGYPTDCPQREKNGWTGDAHLACQTGLYSYDAITVYEKWMDDLKDIQKPNGILPDIIPTDGWGFSDKNLLDWTSCVAVIPWNLYLFYGDERCLRDVYENLKLYVDFVDKNNPSHTTSWGRGDWIPVKTNSNLEVTSSIYFYVDAVILAKAAKMFSKTADAQHYSQLASQIKDAINQKFLNRETGLYASGTMTEMSMALYWGIVPDDMQQKVAAQLADNVRKHDNHIDCGILGTKAVLNALTDNGYEQLAYEMATQDTYPSWGRWIRQGMTTLTENWNIEKARDASLNHIMYGEIGAWFYKALGGILPDEKEPGFKHIVLKPHFIKDLQNFNSHHDSPYGRIESQWTWTNPSTVEYHVSVPVNAHATITLPGSQRCEIEVDNSKGIAKKTIAAANATYEAEPGNYHFTIRMK